MLCAMQIEFVKMQGLGNDFLVFDAPAADRPLDSNRLRALAHRHTGIGFDQAIERVTVAPAHVCNFGSELGTLRPGSEADISIFELREGNFEFGDNADAGGQKRIGHQMLINKSVVCRGQLFANVV